MTAPRPTPPVPGLTGGASPASSGRPDPFARLAERPVTEHVAVFEAEHDRLRRELSTIDQL